MSRRLSPQEVHDLHTDARNDARRLAARDAVVSADATRLAGVRHAGRMRPLMGTDGHDKPSDFPGCVE